MHIPTLMPLDNSSGTSFDDLQFDNQVCEWFLAFPSPLSSPDYYTSYWNGYAPGAPNCSFCASHSLTSNQAWCNDPLPQNGNPFFDGINEAYAGVYTFHLSPTPEILRGQLDPDPANQLIQNHIYYIEGNFAQPHGVEYYGHMEIDVTNQANFIQANYNAATTGIEISFDAFDYDAANPWRKFYNVFTSNGDETNVFIGNLTKKVTTPQSAGTTPTCTELLTASIAYMLIDNIVVKEFLADAGEPTVSVCSNTPTAIGGSCQYPSAQYNWQPANLFNDNTLANPLITTSTNVTCTLTVTITMPGNITATTPPAYVDVEVLQNPTVSLNGSTQVIIGNSTTLIASGASYYTWTATNGNTTTTGSGAELETGILTQQETFTVTGFATNGCSSTASITIGTIQWPTDCGIAIANLQNVVPIPNGSCDNLIQFLTTWYPDNISNTVNNEYVITSEVNHIINFSLAGNLIINNGTKLSFGSSAQNSSIGLPINIICFDGSEIINYGNLEMNDCLIKACNNMWKGITNNNKLYLQGNYIDDAEFAVHLKNGSDYNVNTNVFSNNLYGILMGGINGGQINGVIYSNIFTNPLPLKGQYPGMLLYQQYAEAGIKLINISNVQIGLVPSQITPNGTVTVYNDFHHINAGIVSNTTNLKVMNSRFSDIYAMNANTQQHNGAAIYASSIGAPKMLTVVPIPNYSFGYEFEKCAYGIKTNKNSISANGLKMLDVKYGIYAQNCINGTYRLAENKISLAKTGGIILGQAQGANVIKLTYNEVNLTNANQNKGIEILGSTLGAISGNCFIKSNIVNVGAGASGGILISGLQAPKVLSNHVNKNMFYLTVNSSAGFNGFGISDCNTAYINCNTTTKNNSGGTNLGSDYKINQSPNGFISCNNSGASPYGFDFRGTSPGTTFRTNVIGSQSIGLYVGTSSVLGPQPALTGNATEGNQWTGTYSSGYGAKNLAVTQPNLGQHKFLTKTSDGTTFNPTVSPAIWFNNSIESHVPLCGNSCPSERGETNSNIEFYKAIARGTILTTDYPYESLWMLQGTLYEVLSKDPQLLIDDDSLALFYYSPALEVIKQLKEVSDSLKGIEEIVLNFHLAINGNDSLIELKQNEIEALQISILNDTINDSTLAYHVQIKLAQLELLLQTNSAIYHALNEIMNEHADNAFTLNNEIEPGNANEAIEKDVNSIYLRTLAKGNTNFTASEINLLNNIAHLCPMAAGPSVYRARNMYALINDTVVYQDSAVCAFEGYFRESANVLYPNLRRVAKKDILFMAMPNPASGSINFSFGESFYSGSIIISNAIGAQLQTINVNENSSLVNLNISNYPKGLYFAHYLSDFYPNQTLKFIVK